MNKKYILAAILTLVSICLAAQQAPNSIRDASFARGLYVASPDRNADTICGAMLVDSAQTPLWTLRQYNSKFNMAGCNAEKWFGRYIFTLPGNGNLAAKVVTVNPSKGLLQLECNASAEYTGIRREDQPWIYMTVDAPTDTLVLGVLKSAKLAFLGKVTSYEDCMGFLADKNLHAATCLFTLKLLNINRSSHLYNRAFTLALILFDNRSIGAVTGSSLLGASNAAEGEFVYCPPAQLYMGSAQNAKLPKPRQGFEVNADLLKIVSLALKEAQGEGVIEESYLAEWEIVGCSFGWEMTGTYNACFEISDLRLEASR